MKHNILTYEELQCICKKYNDRKCINDCKNCPSVKHPFCDLYNMGLLGIVERHSTGLDVLQKFKTLYEDFAKGLCGDVEFFLIHPALREYINVLHQTSSINDKYELYMGILVGSDLPWTEKETELYRVNKLIYEIKSLELHNFYKFLLEENQKDSNYTFPMDNYNRIKKKKYPIYEQRIDDTLKKYFCDTGLIMPNPISVFISYAYKNEEHKERVESFTEMLLQMGFDAKMDSMLKADYPDIDQMMIYGLKCDKTIIVMSPKYKEKADNSTGGVWKEFKMITDDLEVNPQNIFL